VRPSCPEAGGGVHPISRQLAARCGYTVGYTVSYTVSTDRYSTLRASYYSCYTHNQDDRVFTFSLNVLLSDGGGGWSSRPVSAVCPGPTWTAREVVCEEDYMEVRAPSATFTTVSSGEVGGVALEVLPVSLFLRAQLLVVALDVTMACPGRFDGGRLQWDVPRVLAPLVPEGTGFQSRSFDLGVDDVLLDEAAAASRGISLVHRDGAVQIRVPFGAEGGYRTSLVEDNTYWETYGVLLLSQHVFTLSYRDGSSLDTRHRAVRRLQTPPVCRRPFSLNKTVDGQQGFRVSLENVPDDVVLEEVWINGNLMAESPEPGFRVRPVLHANGSRGYELQLPFEDPAVRREVSARGVVQNSIHVNFTLTLEPRRESYYHHTLVTARTRNAFPPQITAQCLEGGVSFSVDRLHPSQSLWEVGVGLEALTSDLAARRGYRLFNHSRGQTLEVPVFSVGYTYERINLSNFYGTFRLVLRDARTLQVQTSTSKRCLFRTQDMIACSADGTVTVVASPGGTSPPVRPDRTHLLDRTCRPQQTDGVRVLFQFRLDSCGTREMVRRRDGGERRVTVRCFYPLTALSRLFVDRVFRSETPGLGSVSDGLTGLTGQGRRWTVLCLQVGLSSVSGRQCLSVFCPD
uniref:Uncharacterized protein n=1 Tax=Salarias fasciatus TaxID=181472 RepID=A0A672HJU2_SALFA